MPSKIIISAPEAAILSSFVEVVKFQAFTIKKTKEKVDQIFVNILSH